MKSWIIFPIYLLLHPFSVDGQLSLTQMVYGAESILQGRYVNAVGDSLIFLSKDFHAEGEFNDTIILLQSDTFSPLGIDEEVRAVTKDRIITALKKSKELLLFVHHKEGNVVHLLHSGIRISIDNEVRFINWPLAYKNANFISLPEQITWDEMLHRVVNIETRLKSVYVLNEIKSPVKRNKALFLWLEDHMDEFHTVCDFNADCGWGGFQDVVIRWIIDANILEDTWKAAAIYELIYAGKTNTLSGYLATFMDPAAAFTSEEGLHFLLEKALNENQPIEDRRNALIFMGGALSFILQDTFQNDPYFKKQTQVVRQQEMLDKLMPLMYNAELAPYVFSKIFRLSHSEVPGEDSRVNLSKLPELMQIYKAQSPENTLYRERFADFLLANCTDKQWKDLTGNDAMIYIYIYYPYFNASNQQLRFNIAYKCPEGIIKDKPKLRFEKWVDGRITETFIKDFYNEDGSSYKPILTYIQQIVDVGDLDPGEWTFHLFGVAGDHGQFKWQSEISTFKK